MFSLNDIVVYPGYGVAQIKQEVEKIIGGCVVKLYELQFMRKDVTILVPVDGVMTVGIRKLSTHEDIFSLFNIFCSPLTQEALAELSLSSWNRRSKEYQNKIRKGKLTDLAVIYRDFKTIERQKNLSFGEKAIMSQVELLVAEECAVVEKRPIEDILQEIRICCDACISGLGHTLGHFLSYTLSAPVTLKFAHHAPSPE